MTAQAQRVPPLMTAEELFELGSDARCELIQGEIVSVSPTGGLHGRLVSKIDRVLGSFVEANHLGEVFAGDTGFILARNPDTVRGPDVAFVSHERLPEGGIPAKFISGAPDLAIEVVSPSDTWNEVEEKALEFLTAGCLEVWIVEPRRQSVHVRTGTPPILSERLFRRGDLLTSERLPGFSLAVADLFG